MSRTTMFADTPELKVTCQEQESRARQSETFICLDIDSGTGDSVTLHSINREYLTLIRDVIDKFLESGDKLPCVSMKANVSETQI